MLLLKPDNRDRTHANTGKKSKLCTVSDPDPGFIGASDIIAAQHGLHCWAFELLCIASHWGLKLLLLADVEFSSCLHLDILTICTVSDQVSALLLVSR